MKKLNLAVALSFSAVCLHAQGAAIQFPASLIVPYVLLALFACAIVFLLIFYRPKEQPRVEDNPRFLEIRAESDAQKLEVNSLRTTEQNLKSQLLDTQTQIRTRDFEISSLQKIVADFQAKSGQVETERKTEMTNLDNARKALDQERQRVIAEETRRCEDQDANRDRLWAVHETESILKMKEVCQKPGLLVQSHDNNNLPDDFDTALKPDFMVRLLDQYVVFDSKVSKPDNLQTYLATQAKKTAEKFRKSSSFDRIYKSAFFIVPSVALQYLRQYSFYEQGFMFYVIPTESFEPVLTTLKRLEDYDLADKYDPQERENIVNLIASFEQHIRQQNATNILSAVRGLRVLAEKQLIPAEVVDAIEAARKNIKPYNLRPAELKKLVENPDVQMGEISRLLKGPKPSLDESDFSSGEAK